MTDGPAAKPESRGAQIARKTAAKRRKSIQLRTFSAPEWVQTAEWYLTVRCNNRRCSGLIAFQKTFGPQENPHLRLEVAGMLSIHCPHCDTLVRFELDDIRRKQVVLVQ
jgi:hypothetical protein